jgi:Anti-sigma-K factor rskA, C-terminal
MPNKDTKYDLMYAYALGCLNENDILNFKEISVSDENFLWDELGEFQNLAALMASILTVEIPKPEVKEKVARKLYNLKDEDTQSVEHEVDTIPDDQIFENGLDNDAILPKETKEKNIFAAPELDNEIQAESLEEPSIEDENKIEQSSEEIEMHLGDKPTNEIQEMEVQIEDENLDEGLPVEDKSITENINENEKLNEEITLDEETQGIEIHSEGEPEEEVHIEDIKNNIEQTTEEKTIMEDNNNPFELDDDFLPKRKEPEKFRLEEVDDEIQEKVSQNFIEKFIEHNKSSITEKIDKTIEGVKEQIGSEPEVDESGYELVQPLSKNLSIFGSYNSNEEKDELDENLIDHHLGEDSLKSQELQRVYINKNSGSKLSIIILSILSLLFLGAAVYFYLNFKKTVDSNDKQIVELKHDSAVLYSSKQTSRAVISFLESPNVTVVELGPTDAVPNSSGKLYINFSIGAGYLYTKSLPVLAGDKSLQLWLSSGGKFISLGVVDSKSSDEYYPVSFKPISSPGNTEILVTEEKTGGANQPSSKLLLIGALE